MKVMGSRQCLQMSQKESHLNELLQTATLIYLTKSYQISCLDSAKVNSTENFAELRSDLDCHDSGVEAIGDSEFSRRILYFRILHQLR